MTVLNEGAIVIKRAAAVDTSDDDDDEEEEEERAPPPPTPPPRDPLEVSKKSPFATQNFVVTFTKFRACSVLFAKYFEIVVFLGNLKIQTSETTNNIQFRG